MKYWETSSTTHEGSRYCAMSYTENSFLLLQYFFRGEKTLIIPNMVNSLLRGSLCQGQGLHRLFEPFIVACDAKHMLQ